MPDPVGVGILNPFAKPVRAGVNPLALKRVALQNERIPAVIKAGIGAKIEARNLPEPLLKAIKVVSAADADLLDHLLVEIVQELLPRLFSLVVDFGFEVLLELVKLEADLLRSAALLVDRHNALFKIHARLDGAKHFIAGAKDAIEEPEFLVEKLIDPADRRHCCG